MCTVTLVPHESGCRIVCNRDERRTRPTALLPDWRRAGSRNAIWPVDPEGGGTWIGANDAGVAMVLLNRGRRRVRAEETRLRSRGTIIPSLLRYSRLETIVAHARRLEPAFAPFTLLAMSGGMVAVLRNRPHGVTARSVRIAAPLLFTSSSLGDRVVHAPRRALFDRLVGASPDPLVGQMRFHQHVWRSRPEISVCMSRSDAATVSRSRLDIGAGGIRLEYEPLVLPA
jgi:hypothetical protein